MDVKITKDGNTHVCHSQEQLNRFKAAGWTEVVEKAEPVKKTTKATKDK